MKTMNGTTVAVIGLGRIGKAIATNLVKGHHPVIIASRDEAETQALASQLGELAIGMDIAGAMESAEVIIPAIFFNSLKEFFANHATALSGKIIVDVSNPIEPDGKGGFPKTIPADQSSGKILAALIPENAKFIKAFGTLAAESLLNAAFQEPERKVLFYATDSMNSKPQIEELIVSSGFEPFHVGGMDQAIRIEVYGDLHEYGPLGKTVTLAEAKSKMSHVDQRPI